MMKPRVGSYAVYEPSEEGWQDHVEQLRRINEDLRAEGMEIIEAPEAVCDEASCQRVSDWFARNEIDLLHAVIITWSFDHYTLLIRQRRSVPVSIRTIPGIRTGSIVGGQQLGALLTDLDIEHKLLYGRIGCGETARETAVHARACALKRNLVGARFAMIGCRTAGMTPTAVDEVELTRRFGLIVANLRFDEFLDLADKVDLAEATDEWRRISAQAATLACSAVDGVAATRNYLALKRLAAERNLSGISMGSYPKCQGTACLPLALLNDEGIVAGCEGDMNSTVAMYLLHCLSDRPIHFGEMLEVDESDNSIVSSHCGAGALSLADEDGFILCPVRLANTGVCVRFKSCSGPITFVNLVGRKENYRLCAFEGTAVPTGMVFEGNPLRIQLKTPFRRVWDEISNHGFGHHWMSAYNHVVPVLREFCRMTGVQGVFPDQEGK